MDDDGLKIPGAQVQAMGKKSRTGGGLVFSTDAGRMCPQCRRPMADCRCSTAPRSAPGDGIVRLRREVGGRGGKTVSVISGVPVDRDGLKRLASELKRRCGVGGAVKEDRIEIQGDHRQLLKKELEDRGFTVKLAGG